MAFLNFLKRTPKPAEHQSLRWVFFISSLALVLVTGWAVWDEQGRARRPWIQFQLAFNRLEYRMVSAEMEAARAKLDRAKLEALKGELERARKAATGPEVQAIRDKLAALQRRKADVDQDVLFKKANLDEANYWVEHAVFLCQETEAQKAGRSRFAMLDPLKRVPPELPQAVAECKRRTEAGQPYKALKAKAVSIEREVAKVEPEAEELGMQIEALEADLKKREGAVAKVEEQIAAMEAPIAALQRRLEGIKARSPEIRQVTIEGLEVNPFKEPLITVDRCQTCHLGTDRPGFENLPEETIKEPGPLFGANIRKVFGTHPHREVVFGKHPVAKSGCTACHQGQGPALEVEDAHGHTKHWERRLLEGEMVQATCRSCHAAQDQIPMAPILTQGRALVEAYGCFGCHNLLGFERAEKVGPDLTRVGNKLDPSWLFRWVKRPRDYLPLTRMPYFALSDEEAVNVAAYLLKQSTPIPEQKGAYKPRASPEEGKAIVARVGCLGCHRIAGLEPKAAAPTETGTEKKPEGEAGQRADEKSGEAKAEPAGRPEGAQAEPAAKAGAKPEAVSVPPPLPEDNRFAPDLSRIASKVDPDWLFRWLKNPRTFRPTTKMPNLRLTDDEARAVTAYLMTLGRKQEIAGLRQELATPERVAEGEHLIRKRGCFGCHEIKGFETAQKIAPDLTDFGVKPVLRLFFGEAVNVKQDWMDFTYWKLKNPQIYQTERAPQIMPNFEFTDEQIRALRAFLKSQEVRNIAPAFLRKLNENEAAIQDGRRLVKRYNCDGCHLIENQGGAIRAYYEKPNDAAPPVDVGALHEGEKVQSIWLYEWLARPTSIRPWLHVRMPTFGVTIDEATALTKYFAALAKMRFPYEFVQPEDLSPEMVQAGKLLASRDYFDCFNCHMQGAKTPEGPPEGWAPDLALAKRRLRPEWVMKWLQDPQKIQPGTKMPSFFVTKEAIPPDILGGDPDKQIRALRDYLMNL